RRGAACRRARRARCLAGWTRSGRRQTGFARDPRTLGEILTRATSARAAAFGGVLRTLRCFACGAQLFGGRALEDALHFLAVDGLVQQERLGDLLHRAPALAQDGLGAHVGLVQEVHDLLVDLARGLLAVD